MSAAVRNQSRVLSPEANKCQPENGLKFPSIAPMTIFRVFVGDDNGLVKAVKFLTQDKKHGEAKATAIPLLQTVADGVQKMSIGQAPDGSNLVRKVISCPSKYSNLLASCGPSPWANITVQLPAEGRRAATRARMGRKSFHPRRRFCRALSIEKVRVSFHSPLLIT